MFENAKNIQGYRFSDFYSKYLKMMSDAASYPANLSITGYVIKFRDVLNFDALF